MLDEICSGIFTLLALTTVTLLAIILIFLPFFTKSTGVDK